MKKSAKERNPAYLDWLRDQDCYGCGRPSNYGDRNTAAHIGTSNFGMKAPDKTCIPLCSVCHSIQEVHKEKWAEISPRPLPTLEDAERYFKAFSQRRAGL